MRAANKLMQIEKIYSVQQLRNGTEELLEDLAKIIEVPTASLDFGHTLMPPNLGRVLIGANETSVKQYEEYYFEKDVLGARVLGGKPGKFLSCMDLLQEHERYEDLEIYYDYIRPQNLKWTLGGYMRLPDSEAIARLVFASEPDRRLFSQYEKEYMNDLLPHLVRSIAISLELSALRQKSTYVSESIELLGACFCICDSDLNLVDVSSNFDGFATSLSPCLVVNRNRLKFRDKVCNSKLISIKNRCIVELNTVKERFSATFRNQGHKSSGSLSVVAKPTVVNRTGLTGFDQTYGVIFTFQFHTYSCAIDTDVLRDRYNVTCAEADVLSLLCRGQTNDLIARSRNVSVTTVRQQIKSCLDKTGCNSQIEMVAKLRIIA